MTGAAPHSPRIVKGGIVVVDPGTLAVGRVFSLQYNPDSISRQLQVHGAGDGGDRGTEPMRLTAAPTETIRVEVELDATDALGATTDPAHARAVQEGIRPALAALETLVYPPYAELERGRRLAERGAFEILPAEAPMTLFVWSSARIVPVRITELSIVEEAFDVELHPIRAKVSLGMRTLSPNDLGYGHPGAAIFGAFHKKLEQIARRMPSGVLGTLGIHGVGTR